MGRRALCGRRRSVKQRRLGVVDTGACPLARVCRYPLSKDGLEAMRICTFRPPLPIRTAAALRARDLPLATIAPTRSTTPSLKRVRTVPLMNLDYATTASYA